MKSKNIPADIKSKVYKRSAKEIKDIITKLRKMNQLEESMDKYNRMMQLNYHIQEQFKKKALKEIRNKF